MDDQIRIGQIHAAGKRYCRETSSGLNKPARMSPNATKYHHQRAPLSMRRSSASNVHPDTLSTFPRRAFNGVNRIRPGTGTCTELTSLSVSTTCGVACFNLLRSVDGSKRLNN